MTGKVEIKSVAIIGCGSMGGGMALLFAEKGIKVSLNDPSEQTVNQVLEQAKKAGVADKVEKHEDYADLCKSLGSPRVFLFSLPHGTVGDTVVENLHPYLEKGDIIIDAGNEHWLNTQRRQGKCLNQGVYYVGMGVSGGYQAARRGPSMCPGGQEIALEMVMPLLEKVCARDSKGRPCVGKAGNGGAGHYIKMIHNGIEQAMISAVSEAWQIMKVSLGMGADEIGNVFEKWAADGELRNTFLVNIAADICRTKDEKGDKVLDYVQDKVVQDTDETEGTGIWSNEEAVRLHVPSPSLTTAHYFRLASADRAQRERVEKVFGGSFPIEKIALQSAKEKDAFLEDLRQAVYAACLASYVQGLIIIDKADRENKWDANYGTIIQIWRAGCIIQADYIADLLENLYKNEHGRQDNRNLLYESRIAEEFKKTFPALKRVVAKGTEANSIIPSISASLEYLKFSNNLELPTRFYEAEMDYFGKHMFDLKSEPAGQPVTGKHHFEWKAA
ncbi:6-phosphogluconate dehydrogenase C-terminal domain-like protein [Xylona heveae TC161]|uniref:6-phosphogluconate dehydrogenase, decarboxylating n=1 Tax=Xylona heveae (strain CBS 132557 / TC161) TaxID=1328760 RepID=A0A165I6U1_XYLHT|nr:6-phosphogluconate dehydrogenase C-terminal domain-like protein [Xylona heveae TC161]KZF24472.1 6-phosphogluconate dehydrogenase C-terminal domain-like protein [Xylona heveae TC161]